MSAGDAFAAVCADVPHPLAWWQMLAIAWALCSLAVLLGSLAAALWVALRPPSRLR